MLHIEHAHICGLSLGGVIALWFAVHYPTRIKSAIFADTAARIGSEEIWDARIDAVRAGGMGAVRDAVLARFLSETFRQRHPETTQQIGAMIEATDPAGYIGTCAALRAADLREIVSAIHVPSLILVGALDVSTPPSQSQELHTAIAGSQLVIFPDVAHLSNVEQAEAFSKNVLAFVTRS